MSVRSGIPVIPSAALSGRDGELILLRISVEPRLLEQLLETLAETSYHINPQVLPSSAAGSTIEFPAYESWVPPIRAALLAGGLDCAHVQATAMIAAIAS